MAKNSGSGASYDPAALGGSFGNKLTTYANTDAPVFNQNLHTGMGEGSRLGLRMLQQQSQAPGNSAFRRAFDYAGGLVDDGGLTEGMRSDIGGVRDIGAKFGDIAANAGTENPAYQTLRKKLVDDVTTENLAAFNSSGMFGSDNNRESLAEGLGTALAGADLDQMRYGDTQRMNALTAQAGTAGQSYGMEQGGIGNAMSAAGSLGGLYDQTLAPGQTMREVGAGFDAERQGQRLGDYDLFTRKNDANYNRFLELLSAFSGSAGSPGMAEEVPIWQQFAGYLANNAGNAIGAYR